MRNNLIRIHGSSRIQDGGPFLSTLVLGCQGILLLSAFAKRYDTHSRVYKLSEVSDTLQYSRLEKMALKSAICQFYVHCSLVVHYSVSTIQDICCAFFRRVVLGLLLTVIYPLMPLNLLLKQLPIFLFDINQILQNFTLFNFKTIYQTVYQQNFTMQTNFTLNCT